MIVDDVKTFIQYLADTTRLEEWQPGLLRCERRAKTNWAFEPVYSQIGMILITRIRLLPCQETIRIDAVNDLDLMSATRQLIGKTLNEDAIPPKIIRRIERGNHAKAQRSISIH